MRLEVFDNAVRDWNESEAGCFKEPIHQLDLTVKEWTEILVNKNEITVVFEGEEWSPTGGNPTETMAYYFNVKEEYFDNGGGFATDDAPEVDWDECRHFYKKYAEAEDDFVDALDKGDFERAKRLNKQDPKKLKPSIQNSFYARWIVKSGNLDFLKWAKQVDDGIDFSPNPRFENPLKIAIAYGYEDIGIWLIDNYPVALTDRYEPLGLIKKVEELKQYKLKERMLEDPELVELIVEKGATKLLPDSVKDVFLF
jgi:hypothetical protein